MNTASRSYSIDDVDILDTSDEGAFGCHTWREGLVAIFTRSTPTHPRLRPPRHSPMASNNYLVEATPSSL